MAFAQESLFLPLDEYRLDKSHEFYINMVEEHRSRGLRVLYVS